MSRHSYRLLKKLHGRAIMGFKLLSYENKKTSNFERHSASGKMTKYISVIDEIDSVVVKKKFAPFVEISGERIIRSINLTHDDYFCQRATQTVWYCEKCLMLSLI